MDKILRSDTTGPATGSETEPRMRGDRIIPGRTSSGVGVAVFPACLSLASRVSFPPVSRFFAAHLPLSCDGDIPDMNAASFGDGMGCMSSVMVVLEHCPRSPRRNERLNAGGTMTVPRIFGHSPSPWCRQCRSNESLLGLTSTDSTVHIEM